MVGGLLISAEAQWKSMNKVLFGDVVALEVHAKYEMRVVRPSLFCKVRIEDQ